MKRNSSAVALFDEAGRLVEAQATDGVIGFKPGTVDANRMTAMPAWQKAHNKMLRASRENPAIHIDEMTHTWTDEDRHYGVSVK